MVATFAIPTASKLAKSKIMAVNICVFFALIFHSANAQYDYSKLIPMDQYPQYSRVLDCYSCFMAGGRMCHDKNHDSMFYTTYSSNKGNGICCKQKIPRSGICSGTDDKHVCSMPAYDTSYKSEYKDVFSAEDGRNHQMLAFCPMLNTEKKNQCGIKNNDNTDYRLFASEESQKITSNEIRFKTKNPDSREYDFCHYEITIDRYAVDLDSLQLQSTGGLVEINLMFTKKTNMNIYIYGGKDRFTATKSIIDGNS